MPPPRRVMFVFYNNNTGFVASRARGGARVPRAARRVRAGVVCTFYKIGSKKNDLGRRERMDVSRVRLLLLPLFTVGLFFSVSRLDVQTCRSCS